MRINGDAYRVQVLLEGDKGVVITQGDTFDNMRVVRLFVGLESSICFIRITGDAHERFLTYRGGVVQVDWASPPNIQSQTEWLLWLAELVGHTQGMAAIGLEPELRKFYPKDQMPQQVGAPVVPQQQQPDQQQSPYKPIPLHPGNRPARRTAPLPPLQVINPQEAPKERPKSNPAVSSTRTGVDDDAGGPEGFDVDAGAQAVPQDAQNNPPDAFQPIDMTPGPDGSRIIRVPKLAGEVNLVGRQIMCEGKPLTVQKSELVSEGDREVLILTVK